MVCVAASVVLLVCRTCSLVSAPLPMPLSLLPLGNGNPRRAREPFLLLLARCRFQEIVSNLRACRSQYEYAGDSWNFQESWDVQQSTELTTQIIALYLGS